MKINLLEHNCVLKMKNVGILMDITSMSYEVLIDVGVNGHRKSDRVPLKLQNYPTTRT